MKKIMVLFVVSIFLIGCGSQPEVPVGEAFMQLEELSPEELDAALEKNEALAGRAYSDLDAESAERVRTARRLSQAFEWDGCEEVHEGLDLEDQDTYVEVEIEGEKLDYEDQPISVEYTYGGTSGVKEFSNTCADEKSLFEYYCEDGKFSKLKLDCLNGCKDGKCLQAPFCGDGIVQPPEECDDGNSNDNDGCSADCKGELLDEEEEVGKEDGSADEEDPTKFVGCGDGLIQPPEDCDGLNLGGATCPSLGYKAGNLSCALGCKFNSTLCS